jgi:Gas vesicle synthesis protein GvpL/GvpF
MPMPGGDRSLERLRAAIDELTGTQADEVLADAQARARERVTSMLADALTGSLLEHVHERLPVHRDPPAPDPRRAPPPETNGGLAWYVYGVAGAERAQAVEGIAAIAPGQPVSTIVEGPLAAIISRVPLEEFGETNLRDHLADFAWIEATARTHDAVLDAVRRITTVIPMRLCTVYKSEDALRKLLAQQTAALCEALTDLAGKTEWGIKVFARPSGRRSPAGSAQSPHAGEESGSAYMRSVRRELDREEHEAHLVDQASTQIHEHLTAAASEGVMLALQRPEASGNRGQMILNGAYLVRDEDQGSFHEEVQQMRSRFGSIGLELSASGPWPAYNFLPGVIGVTW